MARYRLRRRHHAKKKRRREPRTSNQRRARALDTLVERFNGGVEHREEPSWLIVLRMLGMAWLALWRRRASFAPAVALVVVAILAGLSRRGALTLPWVFPSLDGDRWIRVEIGPAPLSIAGWVWVVIALGSVAAGIRFATDSKDQSRHVATGGVVVAVALSGVVAESVGLMPWVGIATGAAAGWAWTFRGDLPPDARLRPKIRRAASIREWDRRLRAIPEARGLKVIDVTESAAALRVSCRVGYPSTVPGVRRILPLIASTGFGAAIAQVRLDEHGDENVVTFRVVRDVKAEPTRSKVLDIHGRPTDPIRLGYGLDDRGPATVQLAGWHALFVGRTGSGKSNALTILITAAVNAGAKVWAVDLKGGVELGPIERRFEQLATEPEDAEAVISHLHDEMKARLRTMRESGIRNWKDSPDPTLLVLAVDEAAELPPAAWQQLRALAHQGRAAWVSVVLSAIRPTSDSVPAEISSQLGIRWLGPMTEPEYGVAGRGASGDSPVGMPAPTPGRAVLVDASQRGRIIQTDQLDTSALDRWGRTSATTSTVADRVDGLPTRQHELWTVVQGTPGVTTATAAEQARSTGKPMAASQAAKTLQALERRGLVRAEGQRPVRWYPTTSEADVVDLTDKGREHAA